MKKKIFKAFTAVIFLFTSLSGCAPLVPLQTPTGKPEVTIPDVTKKEALFALTDLMMANGYITENITDDNAVYYKRTYGLYAAPLLERAYQEKPEARLSYDIRETEGGVRIVATFTMILYPESPFKEVHDLSRSRDAHDIQKLLEQLKASLTQ
jgi:predicted small lipoprotein YifL